MAGWTRAHLRHMGRAFRFGARPAIAIYESIGSEFFLAPAPGWLNLGWWDGEGSESEAVRACPRLAQMIAEPLPRNSVILDVANGLGAQDAVIADVARPQQLIALNITEFQLRAGRARLVAAAATPVNADAMNIPLRPGSVDGIISIEAAFHFPSRARFFAEAHRVLKPGGVLTMSDISVERGERSARTRIDGLSQMRFWGIRRAMLQSAGEIAHLAERAGFDDVQVTLCSARVIDPALKLTRERLAQKTKGVPRSQLIAGRMLLRQVERLRAAGVIQYLLIRGVKREP